MLDAHRRVPRRDLVDDLAPQPAARHDVRLVDARQPAAPALGEGEAELDDALDLRTRVAQGVDRALGAVPRLASLRLPEVEAAGQLAHDEQIGPLAQLGAE